MAVNKKVEKYKNRVGRILFELLYGSVFEEARGLSRTVSLQKLSRHLQYSQPDIVGYLEYMKGADLLTDLTINYKTISLTLAPPKGVSRGQKQDRPVS